MDDASDANLNKQVCEVSFVATMGENPDARLQVLGDFNDEDIITTLTNLPPSLRASLLLTNVQQGLVMK
eukprot:7608567-Prorocentrum_lima.AAC.1